MKRWTCFLSALSLVVAAFCVYATERPAAPPDSARADTLLSPAEEHIARGDAYSDKKDYDSAIASYTEAIRLDSSNKVTYKKRGNAYTDKKDYDSAIADYTAAILIDSNYADAYNNRGNAYCYKKDYDSAMADYAEAIRLDSNDADTYYNRGNAYYSKNDYDSAIADYTTVIRLKPNDTLSYYYRGYTYLEKGENDSAIADYTAAIGLNPNNANAYHNRSVAYSKKGRYHLAIVDHTKEIMLDPIRGLPTFCLIFVVIIAVYLIVRFVKKLNSTWWRIIKRTKKLLLVYGLVLSGIMFNMYSDAERFFDKLLMFSFILSAGAVIFYLVEFFKNATGWVASGIKGLIRCIGKSLVEAVWIIVLVFSGATFYMWFIDHQLEASTIITWRDYVNNRGAVTLFAVLLIVLRTVYIVKKINGKRVGVDDVEAV